MEGSNERQENKEVISSMKTYHMSLLEADSKKITGLVINIFGDKCWFLNGKIHREDGPAFEWSDGDKEWYLNGKLHREDGPAIERANGDKWWYLNGLCHREDGPAILFPDGDEWWYLNGEIQTEQEWKIEMRKKKIGKLLV